ncbi:MAG TPA: DUF3616 domain-containing protein [Pyrinomonadaceae bacterium]|nr:DUF3616 domain-containing protein [Pyrinomonadaceae bacterium]
MSYRTKMTLPVIGMVLLFVFAVLAVVREAEGALLLSRASVAGTTPRPVAAPSAPMLSFSGGTFEASGVAHVPGTDGVLFVDDGRTDEVFWMRLGEGGRQAGTITPVKLGASVVDLEGITTDGTHFYVVGSQSKSKGGDLAGLVRFRFDAQGQRAEGVESISGLKRFLAEHVAELRGMEHTKYKDGGINVEGIAWDARGRRLLLGLRSPVVDGHALVVPLRLRDPRGAFASDNLEVEGAKAVRLPLGGAGVRSIEYDERAKAFRVITGAGPNAEKLDFKLWEWDGDAARPALREAGTFDRSLKPEGITRVTSEGRDFTFIVFDTSLYAATD